MFFVFGKRLMGKCDAVPGLFHVSTQFFHINYVPLIPLQTYIVLSTDGKTFRGVPVGFSPKPLAFAWGRMITLIAAVGLSGFAIAQCADARAGTPDKLIAVIGAVLAVMSFVFLMWHRVCTKASFNRACQLGQQLGLNEAGFAQLYQIYGEETGRGFAVLPVQKAMQPTPVTPLAKEMFPCRACGQNVTIDRCYTEPDGRTICHACWTAANVKPVESDEPVTSRE